MDEVFYYLEIKNHYYEKFYAVTAKFIGMNQEERWGELELLVDNRERILNIIRSYDFKISEALKSVGQAVLSSQEHAPRVKELLSIRKAIADRIVALDLQLISIIDEVKSEALREYKYAVDTSQKLESFEKAKHPRRHSKPTKDV